MKIGVVEWGCGGGGWHDGEVFDPSHVFVRQGGKMLAAIASDFVLAGHSVHTLRDSRYSLSQFLLPFDFAEGRTDELTSNAPLEIKTVGNPNEFRHHLVQLSRAVDAMIVIAPETGGRLLGCSHWLSEEIERCWFPTGDFLTLGCSKHATATRLCAAHVQDDYFRGELVGPNGSNNVSRSDVPHLDHVSLPVVIKPDDGAGSEGLRVFQSWDELAPPESGMWRVEPWVAGISVSLVAIVNGRRFEIFEPSYQIVEAPPSFHYLTSKYPVKAEHYARAMKLGCHALEALGPTRGFVGMDLILHETDPRLDVVVDLNPRLTASYVSLRKRVSFNLAARLIEICDSAPDR